MLAYIYLNLHQRSAADRPPVIYFVAYGGIIGIISLETLDTRTIVNVSVMLDGIAYDPTSD